MPKPRPLPNTVPGPAFGVREARELGVSNARLRSSDLFAPFHGIRSLHEAERLGDRCRQYLPRLRDDQFYSHATAALLMGLPLPREIESDPRMHVSGRVSRPRTAGIVGHRAIQTPPVEILGMRVTHPDWLLPELAAVLTRDNLIVVGDALVRRKRAPTTLERLIAHAESTDMRGIRTVREALREVRSGTDSPMETRLRILITHAGLPEPVIGHTIHDRNGDFVGTPDLSYVPQRIAIEYEGAVHRDDPRVFAGDIERRELMQEADWYVIRVISDHVFRTPSWLVTRIARILAARTPDPSLSGQYLLSDRSASRIF